MSPVSSRIRVLICTVLMFLIPVAGVVAQSMPATPATGSPTPSDTIWFVIAPEGKSNGDFFDVQLEAGSSATVSATIGNGSDVPVEAVMYAADAYSGINGGFVLNDSTQPISDPTTWLTFPAETREFQPGEMENISFTVSVPAGTPAGQYITGIAMETAQAQDVPGDAPLLVKYRLASAVLITVPGEVVPGFTVAEVTAVSDSQVTTVRGQVTNVGNIRVRPEGTLVLTDQQGAQILEAPVAMSSVYAGDTALFEVLVPAPIPPGDYTAHVSLMDPDTSAKSSIDEQELVVTEPEAPPAVQVASVDITPMPSVDQVVFASVHVVITNSEAPIGNAEVTLQVFRDGEQVDEEILATAMALQNGETVVEQNYIPETGAWESGTYSFQIVLSAESPDTGVTGTIATVLSEQVIVIP